MRLVAPRAVADLVSLAIPELTERLLAYRIRRSWTGLVGPDIARRARPQALTNGTLQVVVDNSPWLHELNLRADELTARIRGRFDAVRSLRLVLGALPAEPREPLPAKEGRSLPLSPADLEAIDNATSAIKDPTLAAAARRLLTKARRSSRGRGVP
jgi:hypothetical protein